MRSEELLATKTTPPGRERGFASRPRLLAQLEAGLAGGLILVCAAAGSGKTALLADWARRSGHPVAWLTLDAGDDDPVRFWRSVSAALDRLATARPGRPVPGEAVLVLDDFQLVTSPRVHEALAALLDHRPPQLHLVVASRVDPPLPLAGCGRAASSPSCATPTCGAPPRRPASWCAAPAEPPSTCRTARCGSWRSGPRGGSRG
ncbi:hypothetical protein ACI782_11575 [Geodermatophilus sp. SYSU D00703]